MTGSDSPARTERSGSSAFSSTEIKADAAQETLEQREAASKEVDVGEVDWDVFAALGGGGSEFPVSHPSVQPAAANEELVALPEVEKNRDKFYRARVKRHVGGVWFLGVVQDIEMGATTKEKLYRLRYDDRDVEHLALPQVKEATEAYAQVALRRHLRLTNRFV